MKHLELISGVKLFSDWKRYGYSLALIAGIHLHSNAQVALSTIVEPGSAGNPDITSSNDACLENNSTPQSATYTLNITGIDNPTYNWTAKGGINITGGTSGNSATVQPFIDSQGRYNKGRLTVFYEGTKDSTYNTLVSCGEGEPELKEVTVAIPVSGSAYVDLYQKFDYSDQIIGPNCVENGDEFAYSIKDLVSGNLLDGIGIDTYTWDFEDITDFTSGGSFLYQSGDESALTFQFSANPDGGEELKVRVGQCNVAQAFKILTFGKKLPDPFTEIAIFSGCIPISEDEITINNTTETGVIYEWLLGNPNYTFTNGTDPNSQNEVTINIGNFAGYVLLKSSPDPTGSIYCSESGFRIDTIYIDRSLDNASISGDECVSEGTHTFSISPNPSAPINWELPDGWSIVGGTVNENAATIQVSVSSSAVSGKIIASTLACLDDTISLDVNVKPGNPSVISGDTCLNGSEFILQYSISAVNPAADSYFWTYPNGWTPVGPTTGTTLNIQPDGSTSGKITVSALGLEECDADITSELDVKYGGIQPDSILVSKNCINSGVTDQITFSIHTPIIGQTYEWEILPSSSWTIITNNNTSIVVETNGIDGSYEVRARASNDCGTSAWTVRNVDISGLSYDINIVNFGFGEAYQVTNIAGGITPDTINWYIDGVLYQTGNNLLLDGTEDAELCVDVIYNSCITRQCTTTSYAPSNRSAGSLNGTNNEVETSPNPANDIIQLNLPFDFAQGHYTLMDMQGKAIKSASIKGQKSVIRTTDVPTGSYLLQLTIDEQNLVKKIQIQR